MSKMNAVKAGDRARVTFEGVMDSGNYFIPDGAECGWTIHPPEYDAPTFQIERIEPPLKVGDTIRAKTNWTGEPGKVVAVVGEYIGIQFGKSYPSFVRPEQYERIS